MSSDQQSSSGKQIRRRVAKRHDLGDSHDINITPAIDLLVSLIPFLLISAVFIPIASIETTPPSRGAAVSTVQTSMAVVVITSKGLTLTGSGPMMKDNKTAFEIPKSDNNYDLTTLTRKLIELKKNDPTAEDLLLMAEPDITYSAIIDVMDAARKNSDGTALFPNAFFGGVTSS